MNSADAMKDKHERQRFQARAYRFFEEWAPEHPEARSMFEAEFFTLIRDLYREAMEPFAQQLAAAYMTMPPTPTIMEKPK